MQISFLLILSSYTKFELNSLRNNEITTKLLITGRGPKAEVSNERFSAKVKLRCKLDIHTALLSPTVYLRRTIALTVFPGGNIKISNVLKISPRFRAVPLGLRYQGIGSSDTFSVFFFTKAEWLGQGPKSYRRIFASHSSISSLRHQQR